MNAFAVRRHAVAELGISLQPDVLIKLLVFEHRFRDLFKQIATSTTADRAALLVRLEEWAAGPLDIDAPDGLSPDPRPLLAADPHLSEFDLDAYFALARRLSNTRVSVTVTPEVAAVIHRLLSNRPNAHERAVAQAEALDSGARRADRRRDPRCCPHGPGSQRGTSSRNRARLGARFLRGTDCSGDQVTSRRATRRPRRIDPRHPASCRSSLQNLNRTRALARWLGTFLLSLRTADRYLWGLRGLDHSPLEDCAGPSERWREPWRWWQRWSRAGRSAGLAV